MDDLALLANIAEIVGAGTIIGGAVFAIVQIREFRAQRREAITVELMRAFQEPSVAEAVNLVRGLPDGISAEDMRERGPEYERAAIMISTTYETIGYMAYLGLASFRTVQELTGGVGLVMWRKLERWMDDVRAEQSQPSWSEWFHWLADQLERESEQKEASPAYVKHAGWRPR